MLTEPTPVTSKVPGRDYEDTFLPGLSSLKERLLPVIGKLKRVLGGWAGDPFLLYIMALCYLWVVYIVQWGPKCWRKEQTSFYGCPSCLVGCASAWLGSTETSSLLQAKQSLPLTVCGWVDESFYDCDVAVRKRKLGKCVTKRWQDRRSESVKKRVI